MTAQMFSTLQVGHNIDNITFVRNVEFEFGLIKSLHSLILNLQQNVKEAFVNYQPIKR